MADLESRGADSWVLKLGRGTLNLTPSQPISARGHAFDVVRAGELTLTVPQTSSGYRGRSHSLWFGDTQAEGDFAWFETAFMIHPLMRSSTEYAPYSVRPDSADAGQALSPGMGTVQLAWPFSRLQPGALDEFIERWGGWFADAAEGRLQHPTSMPERNAVGSWRNA
jgi:serine/threonine-protein kinase